MSDKETTAIVPTEKKIGVFGGSGGFAAFVAALLARRERVLEIELANAELFEAAQKLANLQNAGRKVKTVLVGFQDSKHDLNELVDEALTARGRGFENRAFTDSVNGVILTESGPGQTEATEPAVDAQPLVYGVKGYATCDEHGSHVSPVLDEFDTIEEAIQEANRRTAESTSRVLYFVTEFPAA